MRKLVRTIIAISLLLALYSAALTYSAPLPLQGSFTTTAFLLEATPTPPQTDHSVIGSTDGIVILGGLIALIIVVPIILRRKSWMQN